LALSALLLQLCGKGNQTTNKQPTTQTKKKNRNEKKKNDEMDKERGRTKKNNKTKEYKDSTTLIMAENTRKERKRDENQKRQA
jgi:hypothetical protein